jgi:hypothetical protein
MCVALGAFKETVLKTFGIYLGAELLYVGRHENADDCWRIYLGWPTKGEVREKQDQGFRCVEVAVTPTDAKLADFKFSDFQEQT